MNNMNESIKTRIRKQRQTKNNEFTLNTIAMITTATSLLETCLASGAEYARNGKRDISFHFQFIRINIVMFIFLFPCNFFFLLPLTFLTLLSVLASTVADTVICLSPRIFFLHASRLLLGKWWKWMSNSKTRIRKEKRNRKYFIILYISHLRNDKWEIPCSRHQEHKKFIRLIPVNKVWGVSVFFF